jgi:6-phosphofructokinase 1
MGRDCGYLALMAGIAGGAEAIVIPEFQAGPEEVAAVIQDAYDRGKPHAIIVVAEGAEYNAARLAEYFADHRGRGFDLRVTVLGYVQRGGAPTFADRMLGTRLGAAAVEQIACGVSGVLVGVSGGAITATPLDVVVSSKKPLDRSLLTLAGVLAK